ncbi:MAG: DUF6920 family protein [Natronomonas sp.]
MPTAEFPRSRRLLKALAALLSLGVVAAILARRRFAAEIRGHVDSLYAAAEPARSEPNRYDHDDIESLPAPVQRYFERVLEPGQPHVRTARLRQQGEFRLGGADADWRPLEATQHVTVRPPGFVWDARIDVVPLVPARVVDLYRNGEGRLGARLFGTIPIASAGPSPEMNEGELLRYLAEAVWVPTALLPASGVTWEAIDDRSAQATLEDGDLTASVVFYFDADDEIERVTADRYRQEDDDYASWTGYFRHYERRDGMRVPTEAEVAWTLPEGDLPYWRATVEDIEYWT